jgi:hypothetical protein
MGVLTNMAMPGNPQELAQNFRGRLFESSSRIFDQEAALFNKYPELAEMMGSDNADLQHRAALTVLMMNRTHEFVEMMKEAYGESTVQASLGTLNKRVVDVVRIFYPNQVANVLTDIQPIDGQVGQIFRIIPRYSNTVPGVDNNSEVFINRPTHENYASEKWVETFATGDGSTATLSGMLGYTPVRPGTVAISYASNDTIRDDGNGNIIGTNVTSGSINYATGAVSITFGTAVANEMPVVAEYLYSSEANESAIRKVRFDLGITPVQARIHPLGFDYSVAAGLAASAHLAIDVQDTLSQLAGQYIKIERDNRLISMIAKAAPIETVFNFDADTDGLTYDRRAFYSEIELKLDAAESYIQTQNGRGGVDWVIAGTNTANLMRNAKGFQAAPVTAPIGAHVIGYLRDGTIPVVKSLTVDTNKMIFGYKGYMAGDSATILAEWIPVYFTPVFQSPTFNNSQGVMSMYDMFINNRNYFAQGTVSNYGA